MKKFVIGSFAVIGGLIAIVIAALFTGFKVQKDEEGFSKVDLFWGAIKVDEKTQRVRIFGDFVDVDGMNKKVKVADIVDVDGEKEFVNIDNGTILVDGKLNVVKIKKDLVSKVEEDKIFIRNDFNSAKLGVIVALGKESEGIFIRGKKTGEDEKYIHVQSDDQNIKIDVKVEM
ncbi:hypothetical protein [Bacteriovorax sp. Seq25_V]|uniref:hypothetical protein n=1 Tax=Bacteriovorax sp. Seq25_V TaxID=1201288 RepID=UPI00038A141B|nr:hypothetical protein [Bacteriovorax sp. Seq25_V]EQC47632.1 hypothetical protein M900_0639 [Bacteriovorax sp. Seq25_V]